jgi:predicted amidohydrolase
VPRKARILTTSFGRSGRGSVAGNRALACELVSAAGPERADLVCLPEYFLEAGVSGRERPDAESLSGPTVDALSAAARQQGTWVIAAACLRWDDGRVRNTAFVLDRKGQLVARYAKAYPTIEECEERGVHPGDDATVVETDFGRVGLAICFDLGWPEHWASLAQRGAEVVVWPSVYDGGFPLRVHAWSHFYHVVSASRAEHSRIIDVTGEVLASTSRWSRLAVATIDLEKEVFHVDHQQAALLRIQRELGARVTAHGYSEENVFTLESNDPAWPLARIKADYGLENYRAYHARAAAIQNKHRAAPSALGTMNLSAGSR